MHADEVSAGEGFVQRYVLDPCFFAADSAGMTQIVRFLNTLDVFAVLVGRIVAENVHVEAGALLDHRQPDSAGADDGNGLSGNFVAKEWQVRMPESPLVLARQVLSAP